MTQQINTLVTKAGDLRSIPRTHTVQGESFQTLPSDILTCPLACKHDHTKK